MLGLVAVCDDEHGSETGWYTIHEHEGRVDAGSHSGFLPATTGGSALTGPSGALRLRGAMYTIRGVGDCLAARAAAFGRRRTAFPLD